MRLYRIATEDFPNLPTLASKVFDGFNLTKGTGYWKGQAEQSATLEILTDDYSKVRQLAESIRFTNRQEAVYITTVRVDTELVTSTTLPASTVATTEVVQ